MAISDDVGRISKEIIYSTFGEVLKVNIKEVDSLGSNSEEFLSKFNLFFTSRFYDSELGLYDFRNRYYHAPTGRFTSMDPIGIKAGDTNYYRYVGNNPINKIDPFGLKDYDLSGGQIPQYIKDLPSYQNAVQNTDFVIINNADLNQQGYYGLTEGSFIQVDTVNPRGSDTGGLLYTVTDEVSHIEGNTASPVTSENYDHTVITPNNYFDNLTSGVNSCH